MFKIGDKVSYIGVFGGIYIGVVEKIVGDYMELDNGAYFTGNRESLIQLVDQPRQPVRGEIVQVRDSVGSTRADVIYIGTIEGLIYPFFAVLKGQEKDFLSGVLVNSSNRKQMRQKPIEEPVDMKISEIIKELGYNIRIVEE